MEEVKNMADKKLKSGEKAPKSGDYTIYGPRGGKIKAGITMDKGETMPPTPKPNQVFKKK
jgi:YjzC-like protein